jgi:hypothetical protein
MNAPGELMDDLRLLEPPNPLLPYYWAGAALALFLIILIGWTLVRRARSRRCVEAKIDCPGAQEDALAALQELFTLVKEEQGRMYAIESSAIIRRFIERRFGIRAPAQSTDEFLHAAQSAQELGEEHQAALGVFLKCCDLLKFGRGRADRAELEELHAAAVRFVYETTASGSTSPL